MTEPSIPFKVKAVYEYKSDFEDDLAFPVEQVIQVTAIEDEDWYSGTYDGKSGMFPKNFVEIIKVEAPAIPIPARPTAKKQVVEQPRLVEETINDPGESITSPIAKEEPKVTPASPIGQKFSKATGNVPTPLFPTTKVNDPYAVKKQFVATGKSSYIPKITPREDRTVHHAYDVVAKNDSEIVKSTVSEVNKEEEEGPKVSLKERIALLQKKQQEEAEREQAALKKQEERKKKLAEDKQKAKERKLEIAANEADVGEEQLSSPTSLNQHTTGGSQHSRVGQNVTGGSQHSRVGQNVTGGSVQSHQSHHSHVSADQSQPLESVHDDISSQKSIPENSETLDEEDEVSEEVETAENDQQLDEDEDEDEEPESDDEELKRRKLVERMAKISGGRNMFGMMGMPAPFGTQSQPEKHKKPTRRQTNDTLEAPHEFQPSSPQQTQLPASAPTNITGLDGHLKSIDTRSVDEPSTVVLQRRESIKHPELIGTKDDQKITERTEVAPTILPTRINDIKLTTSEAGYDADEDSSDFNRTITLVPPPNETTGVESNSPMERVDAPLSPAHLETSTAPPPVPSDQHERHNINPNAQSNELPASPSSLHRDDSSRIKMPPPPPPPGITAHDQTGDIRGPPPPPPPQSIPEPRLSRDPVSDEFVDADGGDNEDSDTSDDDDVNDFAFTPALPNRASTTSSFPPPIPNIAPPPISDVPPPVPSGPFRARTEVDEIENAPANVRRGSNDSLRRRSTDAGIGRRKSVRVTEQPQAELALMDVEAEIGNSANSQSWWLHGELPSSLKNRIGNDLIYETEVNKINKRGGRVIIYRDYYVLFYDLSQIIVELKYEEIDPKSTLKFINYYTKPIPMINKDLLQKYYREFSGAIVGNATALIGKHTNEDIVSSILSKIHEHENKNIIVPIGEKSYGVTIYKNFNNANITKIDEIRPGDILWIKSGKFASHKPLVRTKSIIGDDHDNFTAVIYDFDENKDKFKVIERESNGQIKKGSYKIGDFKSGKIRVFRIVGRDYVGWN